jgi:hypothetical protein
VNLLSDFMITAYEHGWKWMLMWTADAYVVPEQLFLQSYFQCLVMS